MRGSTQRILPLEIRAAGIIIDGTEVLRNISMEVRAGEPSVILGPNAAGKTMLLSLCHGLRKPTYGTVRWHGKDAGQASVHQAMVFQRPVLLRRSVEDNIEFALSCRGISRKNRHQRTQETLKATGLDSLASARARKLSVGQQQRVALARAWAIQPEVLFLDEPIAGLDPPAIQALEDAIHKVAASGTKIVMTTHNLAQAKRIGGEVLFIYEGRLLEQTDSATFFVRPQSSEAQNFLSNKLAW